MNFVEKCCIVGQSGYIVVRPIMDHTNALPRRIRTQSRLKTALGNSKRTARSAQSSGQRRFIRCSSWIGRSLNSLAQSNIRETRDGSRRITHRRRSHSAFRTIILQSSSTMPTRFSWARANSRATFVALWLGRSGRDLGSSRPLGVDRIGDMEGSAEGTEFFRGRTVATSESTYEFSIQWSTVMDRLLHVDLATARMA